MGGARLKSRCVGSEDKGTRFGGFTGRIVGVMASKAPMGSSRRQPWALLSFLVLVRGGAATGAYRWGALGREVEHLRVRRRSED